MKNLVGIGRPVRILERWDGHKPFGPVDTHEKVCKSPGATPYNGLYGEAPPERGTFFRLQVQKRVGISQVEVYKRVGKSVI